MIEVCNARVVYVTDPGYALPTLTSMKSLRQFHDKESLPASIIVFSFSDIQLKEYRDYCTDLGVDLIVANEIALKRFDSFFFNKTHVPKTALAKFLIPEFFDNKEDVIYIDGDTLITSELDELIRYDVKEDSLMAVPDYAWFCKDNLIGNHGKKHRAYFNRSGVEDFYFNSGVFKSNVKKLLEISEAGVRYLAENFDQVLYNDQSGYNYAASKNLLRMSIKWNYQAYYWDLLKITPAIVHFAGACKPWCHPNAPRPEFAAGYYENFQSFNNGLFPVSSWSDGVLNEYLEKVKKEKIKNATMFLPRNMSICRKIKEYEKSCVI